MDNNKINDIEKFYFEDVDMDDVDLFFERLNEFANALVVINALK